MSRIRLVAWMTSGVLLTALGCVATHAIYTSWHIRGVVPQAFGECTTLQYPVTPDITLHVEIAEYVGKQVGFWGADISSPRNLIKSMIVSCKGDHFQVPLKFVNDLANVGNYGQPTIQLPRDIEHIGITTVSYEDRFEVTVKGGDGAGSYESVLSINNPSIGRGLSVRRWMNHYGPG